MIHNLSFVSHSVLLMPHTACSPADDDLPASSSGSLAPSDVDSIPTASTPRDADDIEVGSHEGTHQEEAPEALRESSTRGCPDSRTIIVRRTPRLRRYKIEDSVPCPDGTSLGVEGKLGNTDM